MALRIHATRCIVLEMICCTCWRFCTCERICDSSLHYCVAERSSKTRVESASRRSLANLLFATIQALTPPSSRSSSKAFDSHARDIRMTSTNLANDGLFMLSIDEIKELLVRRGVDFHDCAEKQDFVERLRDSEPSVSAVQAALPSDMMEEEARMVDVLQQTSPAFVRVATFPVSGRVGSGLVWEFPADWPYNLGAGFVWDTQGHIVTSFHLITGYNQRIAGVLPLSVKVILRGVNKPLDATFVGYEKDKDIAVLKIDPTSLTEPLVPIRIGNSSGLIPGQSCLAIGNPNDRLDYTPRAGIVSDLAGVVGRQGFPPIKDCIQTTAGMNSGFGGGPLLDSSGRLIGMNTAAYTDSNIFTSFAIPVDIVHNVVNQIIKSGPNSQIDEGFLLDPGQATYLRLTSWIDSLSEIQQLGIVIFFVLLLDLALIAR